MEPQYNKGFRDWENMFAITRFLVYNWRVFTAVYITLATDKTYFIKDFIMAYSHCMTLSRDKLMTGL